MLETSVLGTGWASGYRVIAKLWRRYFHPPRDTNNTSLVRETRSSEQDRQR
jgi:hypothetical protein